MVVRKGDWQALHTKPCSTETKHSKQAFGLSSQMSQLTGLWSLSKSTRGGLLQSSLVDHLPDVPTRCCLTPEGAQVTGVITDTLTQHQGINWASWPAGPTLPSRSWAHRASKPLPYQHPLLISAGRCTQQQQGQCCLQLRFWAQSQAQWWLWRLSWRAGFTAACRLYMDNVQFLLAWGVFQQPKNNVLVTASTRGSSECKTPSRKKTAFRAQTRLTSSPPVLQWTSKSSQISFLISISVFKAFAKKSMFLPVLALHQHPCAAGGPCLLQELQDTWPLSRTPWKHPDFSIILVCLWEHASCLYHL